MHTDQEGAASKLNVLSLRPIVLVRAVDGERKFALSPSLRVP